MDKTNETVITLSDAIGSSEVFQIVSSNDLIKKIEESIDKKEN